MTAFIMNSDDIMHRLEELGDEWADNHAAATLLEETEKSILAEITAEYRPNCKSQAEAETLARASNRYRAHIVDAVEARRAANKARVRFDAFKTFLEMKRTQAATERAAMQMR